MSFIWAYYEAFIESGESDNANIIDIKCILEYFLNFIRLYNIDSAFVSAYNEIRFI